MKFCGNCGKERADDEMFCPSCGAQCGEAAESENTQPETAQEVEVTQEASGEYQTPAEASEAAAADVEQLKKKKQKTLIAGIAAAVVVILAIFGIVSCNSTNASPKNLVKKMEKVISCKNVSVDDVIKLMDPVMQKEIKEEIKDDKDIKDNFKEMMKDRREDLEEEYGKNYKVKAKLKSQKKIKKDDSDFEKLKEHYKDEGYTVSEAKRAEVEVEIKGKDGEDTNTFNVTMVKIKGKWYLAYNSMFGSLYF